jgi:hypothetical protein
MRTASLTANHAREAAYAAERLQAQRDAAAAARAHANAFQIKIAVAVGCTLASVLGYSLHRVSGAVSSVDRAPMELATTSTGSFAETRVGQVEIPYDGETCRRFHFNNTSGAMTGESFATCGAVEQPVAQPTTGPTRAEAIMNAFRVAR